MRIVIKYLLIIGLLLALKISYGSTSKIDSLQKILNSTLNSSSKIELLNQIAESYSYINFDSSFHFAKEAYKLSLSSGNIPGEIEALQYQAFYYQHTGENKTAHDLLKQAEILSERSGDKLKLASTYRQFGDIFTNTLLFDKAFEYYSSAIELFKKLDDNDNYYSSLSRLGILYAKMDKYSEALELFNQIKENYNNNQTSNQYIGVLNNIATVNKNLGNYSEALKVYLEVLDYNIKNLNYRFASGNLGNIANTYLQLGDTANAYAYLDSAQNLFKQLNDIHQYNFVLLNKCILNYEQKSFDHLERNLKEVYKAAVAANWTDYAMYCAQYLSKYYYELNQIDSAYTYSILYIQYSEKVESDGNTKKIEELKFKYEFEKEALLMEAQNHRKSILIKTLSGLFVMAILLIIILIIQRKTKLAKTILQKQNLELEKDKLQLQQKDLNNQIEIKNKEITSSIILLQKKNDLLASVANTLMDAKSHFTKTNWSIIEKCINDLRENTDDSDWKNFEYYFNQVYESFYEKLNQINPNLTANDRKLCAYIKLQMSTKEIASLTNTTARSIEVARYRLRKKLNIQDSSISINSFLENI